jgi:hypothetical protein
MQEHLNNLISLAEEALIQKDISFYLRTKIERELFLLLKHICQVRLKYNLQGFENKKILDEFIINSQVNTETVGIINRIFGLYYSLCGLTSSNPYAEWDTVVELGRDKAFKVNREDRLSLVKWKKLEKKYGSLYPTGERDYYVSRFSAIKAFTAKLKKATIVLKSFI